MACGRTRDVDSRHVLRLISNVFKNSNARPLYSDTVPLSFVGLSLHQASGSGGLEGSVPCTIDDSGTTAIFIIIIILCGSKALLNKTHRHHVPVLEVSDNYCFRQWMTGSYNLQ